MKKSCAKRRQSAGGFCVALLALGLGLSTAGISEARAAEGKPAAGDSASVQKRELEQLKAEIEQNRRRITELSSKEKDLAERRERLKRDQALTRRYVNELEAEDQVLRGDLADRQTSFLDKSLETEAAADRLKGRLRRFSKLRRVHAAELLLSSRSFNELFARAQFVARWVERDRLDLLALGQERDRISEEAALLDRRRRGLETLQAEKRKEEVRLREQAALTQDKISDVQAEKRRHETRIKELRKTESAIRTMLARLAQEAKSKKAKGGKQPGLAPLRGALLWPTNGEILTRFGYEVHPIYGTRVPMNGVEIRAEAGASIRAALGGTAQFVGWLSGYGNTVILDHGDGWFTLYAHASEILVARGAKVAAGVTIARVGDTDSLRGACLHFEVRHDEEALDPLDWLKP